MTDICLVTMPYGAIERPSIALGLLSQYSKKVGLATKTLYFNLKFAKLIGLKLYKLLAAEVDVADQIGEWTFSKSAFSSLVTDEKAFLNLALDKNQFNNINFERYFPNENIRELLLKARFQSDAFIEECCQEILNINPKFVGLTSTFQQNCASIALIKKLKSKNPAIITAIGGANCEGVMGLTLSNEIDEIDFVFSGEADESFPTFCSLLKSVDFKLNLIEWGEVNGLIPNKKFRNKNYSVDSAPRAKVQDLNSLPIPDYDEYFNQLIEYELTEFIEPGLLVETARGCWWGKKKHCVFCGLNGENMDFRSKSPKRFVNEIDELSNKYGINRIEIVDNILDMKYFNSVFYEEKLINKPYSIFCETKSNLNEKQIIALSKNRIKWIQPGIESLHKEVIKIIQKGNTTISSIELLKYALENGVRLSWNFLFGFPEEKDVWYEEMSDWIPLISHLQPPSNMVRVRFDRFSPYHSLDKFYGLNLSPNISYTYVYPFDKKAMENIAYFFEDYTLPERGNLEKKGINKLIEVFGYWKLNFEKNQNSKLIVSEGSEASIIWDSRPKFGNGIVVLAGLQNLIHNICRKPSTIASIKKKLELTYEKKINEEIISKELEGLLGMNLIFKSEEKYISLATYSPSEELLSMADFPGGYINLNNKKKIEEETQPEIE